MEILFFAFTRSKIDCFECDGLNVLNLIGHKCFGFQYAVLGPTEWAFVIFLASQVPALVWVTTDTEPSEEAQARTRPYSCGAQDTLFTGKKLSHLLAKLAIHLQLTGTSTNSMSNYDTQEKHT